MKEEFLKKKGLKLRSDHDWDSSEETQSSYSHEYKSSDTVGQQSDPKKE